MASHTAHIGLLHYFTNNLKSLSIACTLAIFVVMIFSYLRFSGRNSSIPIYGLDPNDDKAHKKRWMTDSINLIEEGYKKFQGIFQVWTTEGMQVVLSPKYVDELKMLPETTIETFLPDFLQTRYTMPAATDHNKLINRLVRLDLNKQLPKIIPQLKEELDHALSVELLVSDDWTPITLHPRVIRILSRITGLVFVGPSLNRTEDWIRTNCDFTRDAFLGATKLRTWNPILRPLAQFLIPELQRIREHNAVAKRYILPIIAAREKEERDADEKANDSIQWTYDALNGEEKKDLDYQANVQLVFGGVSIHTTSQMVTNIIYDLCARPQYMAMLREEVRGVLQEHGGKWNSDSVNALKKLDSFMKESQRYGGAIPATWNRRVVKPVTLSNGTFLTKGTLLFSAALAISSDSSVYENAEQFDGLRFYKLQQRSKEDATKYMFTSTGSTMMHFGAGRHACPGRFFASYEIKMIIASLLLSFEFAFHEGEQRPKSILWQTQNMPDPTKVIMFRRLKE